MAGLLDCARWPGLASPRVTHAVSATRRLFIIGCRRFRSSASRASHPNYVINIYSELEPVSIQISI